MRASSFSAKYPFMLVGIKGTQVFPRGCWCWCCGCSVAQSCLTLCNLLDCGTLGLSVPHHLPKFAQVQVHCIKDAIQPSHPLMSSSPSALNLSQLQGLFQWVSCLHQVTKILELQLHISPSNEYSGLTSLKIDWFDLREMGLCHIQMANEASQNDVH